MSRAFVKELDEQSDPGLQQRPQSPHVNYVTPLGLRQLQDKVREASELRDSYTGRDDLASQQQLKRAERDLQYFAERVHRAVLVQPDTQPDDRVHFGAKVEVEDAGGERLAFSIVGEDEADVAAGKISWVSPLARALLNSEIGDSVVWKRPAGDKELTITAIRKD
jgi:transcription elongation GreA/GreB family factor